jgi:hypothetical protein
MAWWRWRKQVLRLALGRCAPSHSLRMTKYQEEANSAWLKWVPHSCAFFAQEWDSANLSFMTLGHGLRNDVFEENSDH